MLPKYPDLPAINATCSSLSLPHPTIQPHNHSASYTSIAKMVSHKTNHKHKKPFRPHSGSKWNAARPKRANRPRYNKPRLNGGNTFFSLPAEMHHQILQHLPPRDISSSRQTCQFFFDRVGEREPSLAQPQIEKRISDLRAEIEEIKSRALPPSDADSFLESLGFWVSRRGCYASMRESSSSLEKWFGFVFGWDESATHRWARLSVEALRLYQHLCEHNGTI